MRSSIRPGRRDPQHLGAVVVAVGDPDRRPGRAARRRPELQALVRVDRRRGERAVRARVRLQAADEVVGGLRQAEAARVVLVEEDVRRRPARATCGSGTVAGQRRERLRHERRDHPVLLGERVHHVAEEDRAVAARRARRRTRSSARTDRSRPRGRSRSCPSRARCSTATPWSGSRTAASGPPCRSRASRACRARPRSRSSRRRSAATRKYSSSIPILNS